MGHNPATRDVKASERKKQNEERTPDQRLADIRKNRAAKLFVTPDDQDFLLTSLDAALAAASTYEKDYTAALKTIEHQVATIQNLEAKIEEFRQVYEEENRSMAVKVARIAGEESAGMVTAQASGPLTLRESETLVRAAAQVESVLENDALAQ